MAFKLFPKKYFALIAGAIVLACVFGQSESSPKTEASCLESETLRVEIGGEKFAFPRNMLVEMRGPDVVNIDPRNKNSATPSTACQQPSDPIWILNQVSLTLRLKPCPSKQPNCLSNRIIVDAEDSVAHNWGNGVEINPKTKRDLLLKCKPPSEPIDASQPQYWAICHYVFQDEELFLRIMFNGQKNMHPPQEIEKTQASVMRTIRQYRISEGAPQ